MKQDLKNKVDITVRPYVEDDFSHIHNLNIKEKWNNLVEKSEDTQKAWENSNIKYVACFNESIIGYIRGLTDGNITLFVSELLIDENYRGLGIGTKLLKHVHKIYPKTRIDLLATSSSQTYYESNKFRSFYGFRKTIIEWD
ncbi:GNAT family N-acetyltransferase [Gottfriedia luciferensis]|uniref:GNAT family N-acetyltransferase n=1 Tax=Gottfriedia luciferensis TaxID=178774 RepID=UPI000B454512|nr:GNAT family N-acetyltransferase [Gottfriedia luciferensis]